MKIPDAIKHFESVLTETGTATVDSVQ